MNKNNGSSKPLVYSYSRFSSPEQAKGDSERRQWESAQEYAAANGFTFDESLRMTDRGLSGFHGTHRKKGVFGAFLEKVRSGVVSPGSILVVENTDRLGREPMIDALQTIVFGLIKHGIIIQMLCPRHTYTTASINDNDIWMLISDIKRANAESERKSQLAQANWRQKRKLATEEKKMLTSRAPAWLRVVNGKFVEIPEAAETVRLIFKLKLEGLGKITIERKLNQTPCWNPGKGWRSSYIDKILRNRAVVGEYQPHKVMDGKRVPQGEAIKGYFPAIVSSDTFHAVQKRIKEHTNKGGQTGAVRNVLRNLVTCGYCGGSVTFLDKGSPPKGGRYLVCENGRSGVTLSKEVEGKVIEFKCAANPVSYAEVEQLILDNCSRLRPEMILPTSDEHSSEVKRLRLRIEGLGAQRDSIVQQKKTIVSNMTKATGAEFVSSCQRQFDELVAQQSQVEAERAKAETSLHDVERGFASFQAWEKNLAGLKQAIVKDVDARVKLNSHLKEFISKIELFAKGHEDNIERAEGLLQETELPKAKAYPAFCRYIRSRLLSSDGRCLKLHFKSAKRPGGVPMAPVGSLAYRVEVRGKSFAFSGPDLQGLFSEFFDGRKPGFVPKQSALDGYTRTGCCVHRRQRFPTRA